MHCTVPSFLKAWFERHFSQECSWHDERYVQRDMPKTIADAIVSWRMARKYKWSWWLIFAFIFLVTLPKAYGMWYRDEEGVWRW